MDTFDSIDALDGEPFHPTAQVALRYREQFSELIHRNILTDPTSTMVSFNFKRRPLLHGWRKFKESNPGAIQSLKTDAERQVRQQEAVLRQQEAAVRSARQLAKQKMDQEFEDLKIANAKRQLEKEKIDLEKLELAKKREALTRGSK